MDGGYVEHVLPPLVLLGIGIGVSFPSLMSIAMSGATREDAGLASFADFPSHPTLEELLTWRAMRPADTNSTTPRDMTRLLSAVAQDRAASAEGCALVRSILSQQVWPHRLASGFPEDDVVTGGKTGTLPRVRNEVGLVTYPDGAQYAVACFTWAHAGTAKNPQADAVIGRAARLAVDALRG